VTLAMRENVQTVIVRRLSSSSNSRSLHPDRGICRISRRAAPSAPPPGSGSPRRRDTASHSGCRAPAGRGRPSLRPR